MEHLRFPADRKYAIKYITNHFSNAKTSFAASPGMLTEEGIHAILFPLVGR